MMKSGKVLHFEREGWGCLTEIRTFYHIERYNRYHLTAICDY